MYLGIYIINQFCRNWPQHQWELNFGWRLCFRFQSCTWVLPTWSLFDLLVADTLSWRLRSKATCFSCRLFVFIAGDTLVKRKATFVAGKWILQLLHHTTDKHYEPSQHVCIINRLIEDWNRKALHRRYPALIDQAHIHKKLLDT